MLVVEQFYSKFWAFSLQPPFSFIPFSMHGFTFYISIFIFISIFACNVCLPEYPKTIITNTHAIVITLRRECVCDTIWKSLLYCYNCADWRVSSDVKRRLSSVHEKHMSFHSTFTLTFTRQTLHRKTIFTTFKRIEKNQENERDTNTFTIYMHNDGNNSN